MNIIASNLVLIGDQAKPGAVAIAVKQVKQQQRYTSLKESLGGQELITDNCLLITELSPRHYTYNSKPYMVTDRVLGNIEDAGS